MKKINPWGVGTAALGLITAVGAGTFLRPCVHADGSASVCAGAGAWLLWLGILTAAAGILTAVLPGRTVRAGTGAAAAGVGVLILLAPGTLTPLCTMASMRCRMVTRPGALVLGVLIAVCGAVSLVTGLNMKRKKA